MNEELIDLSNDLNESLDVDCSNELGEDVEFEPLTEEDLLDVETFEEEELDRQAQIDELYRLRNTLVDANDSEETNDQKTLSLF